MKPPRFRFLARVLLASGLLFALSSPARAAARPSRGVTYDGSTWLGVSVEDLGAKTAAMLGLPIGLAGALIRYVHPGSPAERSGLLAGDVILQVNGDPIAGAANLIGAISTLPVDTIVSLDVRRGKEHLEMVARLDYKPSLPDDGVSAPERRVPSGSEDAFDLEELDLFFPPGWESGFDPATAAELRKLVDEMRRVIKGTRLTFAFRGSDLKDPFAGEPRRSPAATEDAAPRGFEDGRSSSAGDDEGDYIDPWDPRPEPKPRATKPRARKPKAPKPKAAAPMPAKEPKRLPEVEVSPSATEPPSAPPPPAPRRARPGT